MNEKVPASAQIATLLGMVSQLYTTRMDTLLGSQGFTLSQFALLNHLGRSDKARSISELTAAMEINQPGVSKIVQKFQTEDLIEVTRDKADARRREVRITVKGREKISQVSKVLYPDISAWFRDWQEEDIKQFAAYLGQFAHWLDDNRLET